MPVHVGCNLIIRWLQLPQLRGKAMSLLACCTQCFRGLLLQERRKRGPVSSGQWRIHMLSHGTGISRQMPGFVSSLGSHSHDPSQSEAASQFLLFVQQRWRPQFIPSERLKSLPSSSLPPQRLQEVSRNSDSAGVVVASNSIPRR